MANNKNEKARSSNEAGFGISLIMGIFALVMLCVFPLVYHDFYFDILETKYQFYCVAAIAMVVIVIGYGLWTGVLLEACKQIKTKNIIKGLSVTDWAMIALWFAHVMSWILCVDFRWEAFWGTSGRYNGVFLYTVYLLVYFTVTRLFVFRKWYLDAFLVVGVLVCLFGISDYFQMDILGFKVNMIPEEKAKYTSTFGNINTYVVYVGAMMCVSTMLFALEKNMAKMLKYFAVMFISMIALIIGNSDSGYLTLAALFGFSPLYLFRTKTGVRRYIVAIAAFLTAVMFLGWTSTTYADMVLDISGVFPILVRFKLLPLVTASMWGLAAIATVFAKKKKDEHDELHKGIVLAWMAVIAAVVATVGFMLYDANFAGNAERYGALQSYLVFNDSWGSGRGFAWRATMEIYNNALTIPQKLFGYGADTLVLLMFQYFPPTDGIVYDSVHNEYLHFLITVGFVGMVSYIVLLASAVIQMFKQMKDRPEIAAIAFAIVAFAVQATVNINLPVVMPLIFQLLLMGIAKKEKTECRQ